MLCSRLNLHTVCVDLIVLSINYSMIEFSILDNSDNLACRIPSSISPAPGQRLHQMEFKRGRFLDRVQMMGY